MREVPVSFKSQGQRISAILHLPDKETNSIILLVHGFTGDKNGPNNIFVKLARELSKNNFAVLRFDFRGSGKSGGEFVDMTISDEVNDLKTAIDFVKKKQFKKIGIVGESLGGAITILGCDKLVDCVVLWYPVIYLQETPAFERFKAREEDFDTKGFVTHKKLDGRIFKIGKSFYYERKKIKFDDKIIKISCPVMIVTGNNDTSVPHNQSERAIKLLNGPKKLEIIKGSEHCFRNLDFSPNRKYQQKAIELTVDWFNKWLK